MRDNKTLIALLIVVTCISIVDVSRADLLFKDNFNTKSPTLDINPDPDPGNDAIGRQTGSRYLSLWFADGANYPGQADIRRRKRLATAALKKAHRAMPGKIRNRAGTTTTKAVA